MEQDHLDNNDTWTVDLKYISQLNYFNDARTKKLVLIKNAIFIREQISPEKNRKNTRLGMTSLTSLSVNERTNDGTNSPL